MVVVDHPRESKTQFKFQFMSPVLSPAFARTHPPFATKMSVVSVLNDLGLERKDLDFLCTPAIINRIAGEVLDDYFMIGRELEVSNKTLTSIDLDDTKSTKPELKAVAVLDSWMQERGRRATCINLAEVLYRRNKRRAVEILCEEVTRMKRDDTITAGSLSLTSQTPRDYGSLSTAISRRPLESQLQPLEGIYKHLCCTIISTPLSKMLG